METSYVLAIDFGTSNTSAAVGLQGRGPATVRLEAKSDAMPSSVFLSAQGHWAVGEQADNQARMRPEAFERTPKRRLAEPMVALGSVLVPSHELVGHVLRQVLSTTVARSEDVVPWQIVMTHPQSWARPRRDQLRAALASAGYRGPVRMVSEPIAAAYHYADQAHWAPGSLIAVVDFGGGTFDAALLRVEEVGANGPKIAVIDATGVDPLGGDDFDVYLELWVLRQLTASGRDDLVSRLEDPAQLRWRLMLREAVQRAKHDLSARASTQLGVQVGEDFVELGVTQQEFENLIADDVWRAVAATRALLDAHGGAAALTRVYLTGGSSLIPLVQREMQALTEGKVARMDDPKQVTALGALKVPGDVDSDLDPVATPGRGGAGGGAEDGEDAGRPDTGGVRLPPPPPPPPPPPRRPWLKWVGIAAASILALVVIAAIASSGDGSSGDDTTTSETDVPTSEPSDEPTDGPSDEPTDEPTDEPAGCQLSATSCDLVDVVVASGLADEADCYESGFDDFVVGCTPAGVGSLDPSAEVLVGYGKGKANAFAVELGLKPNTLPGYSQGGTSYASTYSEGEGAYIGYTYDDGSAILLWSEIDEDVSYYIYSENVTLDQLDRWWDNHFIS